MDGLPRDLVDKILFRVDLRSLAMMRCTNRSLQAHINDPYFESEYSSHVGSDLLHISAYGSSYLSYNPSGDSRSLKIKDALDSHILGSCSGLLLLVIDERLCLLNPLTKKFRFFNQSSLMRVTGVLSRENKRRIGLAVDQVDRTTQSIKVVHMVEDMGRTYMFEINGGNSWSRSVTTITCRSRLIKPPVYLDGSLHWLINDGTILAFNPKTEKARLIQVEFPRGLSLKTLFVAGDNRLTLISATAEVIYFYALENILSDRTRWVLVKQIQNGAIDKEKVYYWDVVAYNGKCLVLSERSEDYDRVVHVYHLSANKWVTMGLVPGWCDANEDFFQFTRSVSSVVGLDEILACGKRRISSLSSIIALIDGSSSEIVEKPALEKTGR